MANFIGLVLKIWNKKRNFNAAFTISPDMNSCFSGNELELKRYLNNLCELRSKLSMETLPNYQCWVRTFGKNTLKIIILPTDLVIYNKWYIFSNDGWFTVVLFIISWCGLGEKILSCTEEFGLVLSSHSTRSLFLIKGLVKDPFIIRKVADCANSDLSLIKWFLSGVLYFLKE